MKTRDLNTAIQAFRDKGGTLRTRDLIALGVHTDALKDKFGEIVEDLRSFAVPLLRSLAPVVDSHPF